MSIGLVIAILLINLGITTWGVLQLRGLNEQLQQRDLPLAADSSGLQLALSNEETGLRGYLLTAQWTFLQPLLTGQVTYGQTISDLRTRSADIPAVAAALAQVESAVQHWIAGYEAPALAGVGKVPQSTVVADAVTGKQLFDSVRTSEQKLSDVITTTTNGDFSDALGARLRIMLGVIGASVVGVLFCVGLLLLTSRYILRPVAGLRQVARAMSEGEPASDIAPPKPPELREVYDSMLVSEATLRERQAALGRANDELVKASQMKSDFLATMSHELRTPLNAILGFTDLVRSGATGPVTPLMDDHLERVRRNGSILLDLINDVLDLSKIEAGRMTLTHDVVVTGTLVRRVMANVQALADAKGLRLAVTGDTEALALADPRGLHQILTNLIGNAVKFTAAGSVTCRIRADRDATFIDVTDTGPGIAADHRAEIFEPFRQVGEHATTGTGGTGLGLAISVRLARLMGGDITLMSEPGAGSRFTVRLPAVRPSQNGSDSSRAPLIMAIDDDLDSLSLWQAQVGRMGLQFVGVQQSAAAVDSAASLRPVAILLDIIFPEGDGWDILERLREDPRTADIPVHVVSVVDGEERARDATVKFMQKPVTEERLRQALAQYRQQPVEVAV
ncbi:MAG: CHASE3 domain-containing protein [Candidatus Dormibacteraeota bacterium]|nr:CHASE3 domain-containing protein [Candidatus Dormibacteraeota bacterium]